MKPKDVQFFNSSKNYVTARGGRGLTILLHITMFILEGGVI